MKNKRFTKYKKQYIEKTINGDYMVNSRWCWETMKEAKEWIDLNFGEIK